MVLVITVTKFTHGAWVVVLLIPLLVMMFLAIHRHYADVAGQLSLEGYTMPSPMQHTVLVLVGDLHKGVIHALQYAQTLSPSVKGVYVELDPDRTRRLEEKWIKWSMGVPLVVLSSPYRSLLQPFLENARARVGGIVRSEERDSHRSRSRSSCSQRRAYFAKTENAASQQSTMPRLPSRMPPSRKYMRRNRSHGRKRSRLAEARTPRRRSSSADAMA